MAAVAIRSLELVIPGFQNSMLLCLDLECSLWEEG